MKKRLHLPTAAAVLILTISGSSLSRAEGVPFGGEGPLIGLDGKAILGGLVLGAASVSLALTGVYYLANDISIVDRGERDPGDRSAGIYVGLLNGITGAIWVVWSMKYDQGSNPPDFMMTVGLIQIGLAAADIGLSLWANSQPERQDQRISISPLVMQDADGNAAFGVGLNLANW